MQIYDGAVNDTTNHSSDSFLKINSCGFQDVLSQYTVVRETGRSDYHIILINSGECEARYNGEIYRLTPGDFIIYYPHEAQQYTFRSEASYLWCHFTGTILQELLTSCNISGGICHAQPDNVITETFSNLIQRFYQAQNKDSANADLMKLIYCIGDIVRNFGQKDKTDLLLPVLTYITFNYTKRITLDELAKKSGYSKTRFIQIFSETTGKSPMKYLNDVRLKVSCRMLLSTNHTISEIAYNCGFSDPLYYSRLFRKKYKVSPSEYKKR